MSDYDPITIDEFKKTEINNILKDEKVKNLLFKSSINWMAVIIVYLRNSSCEVHPRIVACANDLEDAIADGDSVYIWKSYYNLISTSKNMGIDLINIPLQFFGKGFY